MAIEVILRNGVKEAIKKTYIALKKGKKEAFNIVEIDDAPISTTGIFHVKLRHLDDFLQYDLFKTTKEKTKDYITQYAELNNLDLGLIQSYIAIWAETKKQMEEIGRYSAVKGHPNIYDKLLNTCGKRNINTRIGKLKEIIDSQKEDGLFKDKILSFAKQYSSFLEFEKNNQPVIRTINLAVENALVDILKDPLEARYDPKRQDFIFCSDKYHLELVLVLKTQKTRNNAELITAYSKRYSEVIAANGIWQLIYTRQEGCKLK